jgi:spore coat protein JB
MRNRRNEGGAMTVTPRMSGSMQSGMMTQEEALRNVSETGFAIDDIILYLDTHTDDPQAMAYYQYAMQANQDAIAAYENAFGPLMFTNVDADTWTWTNSPWPWEGGR